MLEEIAEQPAALAKTIAAEREKVERLARAVRARDVDLIVLVARGSSDNAALFGRYLLEINTGIPVSLSAPSVHTLYRAKLNLKHAEELIRIRELTSQILAKHTGQDLETIERDVERDRYLSAIQAKEYGLIDEVIAHRE